jgi:hypothetical protein
VASECEVITHIKKSPEEVWEWMSDLNNLLKVNMFHESVVLAEPVTGPGPRVSVPHSYFGVYRQARVVHIRDYHKYFIGFGETKAREEPGTDPFPHYQSFEVVPLQDGTCLVINFLRGVYQFPGAKRFGPRIFARWMPAILGDDNANIAIGVGAMDPQDKPKFKVGLMMWPFMAIGGRVISQRARRKIARAEKEKSRSAKKAQARPSEPAANGSGTKVDTDPKVGVGSE